MLSIFVNIEKHNLSCEWDHCLHGSMRWHPLRSGLMMNWVRRVRIRVYSYPNRVMPHVVVFILHSLVVTNKGLCCRSRTQPVQVKKGFACVQCQLPNACIILCQPRHTKIHVIRVRWAQLIVCLPACLSVCLPVCLCVCLYVCLSACLGVCLFILLLNYFCILRPGF